MVTTKQVREVMAKFNKAGYGVYTNKTLGEMGLNRRVKCYGDEIEDAELIESLKDLAGSKNVKCYKRQRYGIGPSIVVKCELAV